MGSPTTSARHARCFASSGVEPSFVGAKPSRRSNSQSATSPRDRSTASSSSAPYARSNHIRARFYARAARRVRGGNGHGTRRVGAAPAGRRDRGQRGEHASCGARCWSADPREPSRRLADLAASHAATRATSGSARATRRITALRLRMVESRKQSSPVAITRTRKPTSLVMSRGSPDTKVSGSVEAAHPHSSPISTCSISAEPAIAT